MREYKGYFIDEFGNCFNRKKKPIKTFPNNKGYMRFQVYTNNFRKWFFVHITVVNLFGDKYGRALTNGLDINHIDGNKRNNSQSNLEVITHLQNIKHRDGVIDYLKDDLPF